MKITAVIPTLNEEGNIRKVLNSVSKYVDEIIVTDGYSKDNTVRVAKEFGAKILYDNIGKGSALRKGINTANGDVIVLFDCDLSHRASEIGKAIKLINDGYEICMPSRTIGHSDDLTKFRKFLNMLLANFVNFVWGSNYTDVCYGFRVAKKSALKKLDLSSNGFEIETEISIKAAKKRLKTKEIPTYEKKRKYGESKFNLFFDGLRIIRRVFVELIKH